MQFEHDNSVSVGASVIRAREHEHAASILARNRHCGCENYGRQHSAGATQIVFQGTVLLYLNFEARCGYRRMVALLNRSAVPPQYGNTIRVRFYSREQKKSDPYWSQIRGRIAR
jgi:hypothetical protein